MRTVNCELEQGALYQDIIGCTTVYFTDGFPEAAELFFFLTYIISMTADGKDLLICN